jgi:drug/metabolite transporter (DMT)-like permease
MLALRHVLYFIALGLFWGVSPSLYKYWGESGVPVSHVIGYTGFGLAVFLSLMARAREGSWGLSAPIVRYGLICATLMNVPFAWSLTLARYVPAPELAIVFSVSPIVSFVVGAVTGRDPFTGRRVLAILFGFAASTILVVTREGMVGGQVSWWLIAAFINPVLWAAYNWYAQTNWPKEGTTFSVGASESLMSGLLALPFVFVMAPPWSTSYAGPVAWWSLIFATFMWLAERVAFFTLIREKGASYTSQAVYLSSPAAVFIAMYFFGGAGDVWLWFSLGLLMVALYLNNSGKAVTPAAIPPSS